MSTVESDVQKLIGKVKLIHQFLYNGSQQSSKSQCSNNYFEFLCFYRWSMIKLHLALSVLIGFYLYSLCAFKLAGVLSAKYFVVYKFYRTGLFSIATRRGRESSPGIL